MKIDGRLIAADILGQLKKRVNILIAKNVTPHMHIILITDDPATLSYIKQKQKYADLINAKITVESLNAKTTTEELLTIIEKLNTDYSVHGIIVQRPAPKQINLEIIDNKIYPEKEIDGFGKNTKYDVPVAKAIVKILDSIKYKDLKINEQKAKIAIIGKGTTAGEPIINNLQKKWANLKVIDTKTQEKEFILNNSDIVISAVGKSNIINAKDMKPGAVIIGVGLHLEKDGKLHGDYNEEEISKVAGYYTPTPGGVGPINVACLLENLVEASENSLLK